MLIFLTYEILEKEKIFIVELLSVFKANSKASILIHQQNLLNILPFIKPSIIIFKSAGFERKNWYYKAKKYGHLCICYESDGLFLNAEDMQEEKICKDNLRLIEKFFVCGPYQLSLLQKKYNSYLHKFKLVGSPTIDFHKKNSIYNNNNFQNECNIGIITSFEDFNYKGKRNDIDLVKTIQNNFTKRKLVKLEDFIEVSKRGFIEFQKITKLICNIYTNKKVILRIQHSGSIYSWEKLINKYPNLTIDTSRSINEFLSECSRVISFKNNLSIEALALKNPIINYCPKDIDPKNIFHLNDFAEKFSINIDAQQKLLNYLNQNKYIKDKLFDNNISIKNAEEICYGFSDHKYSSSKIINDELTEIIELKGKSSYFKSSFSYNIFISFLSLISQLYLIFRNPKRYLYVDKSKTGRRYQLVNLNKEIQNSSFFKSLTIYLTKIVKINI